MHFLSLLMCKILYITITNVISNKRILCTSRCMSMWSQNAMCRLTGAYSIYRGKLIQGLFTKSRNPRDLPSTLTALLTLWGWFRELSRLLVRSFRDFSSIFEEMAFSKKSFDAIFSPSAANCRVRVAAWWSQQQQAAAREVEVEEESRVAVCFTHHSLIPTAHLVWWEQIKLHCQLQPTTDICKNI